MSTEEAKAIEHIKHELQFIRRCAGNDIEGNFEAVDEIRLAVSAALDSLEELRLRLMPTTDDEEIALPLPVLVTTFEIHR